MREIIMGVAALGTVGGGAYYTYEPGELYNVPIAQAASDLENMATPEAMAEVMGAIRGLKVEVTRKGNESVSWSFDLNGLDIGEFKANLFDKGGTQTRVTVAFTLDQEMIDKGAKEVPQQAKILENVAGIAMVEQVDSTLEKRPYDVAKVGQAVAIYMISNIGEMMSAGAEMMALSEDVKEGKSQSIGEKLMNDPAVQAARDDFDREHNRDVDTEVLKEQRQLEKDLVKEYDRISDAAARDTE